MKKFWLTCGRERNLMRYSEFSDQKDAISFTYEEAKKYLLKNFPAYEGYADNFLKGVMSNPFNDWTQFSSSL